MVQGEGIAEMVIAKEILDELTAKAKENPRLRCNLDMLTLLTTSRSGC